MFSATEILKSFASEIITIDEVHHFFVFGDIEKLKTIPVVFAFGEVCSYQIETAGRKTFIKKKIRIGRAADSGDAACCTDVPSGGGTSGGERKSICREGKTKINFIMYGERLQRESANYPAGFTAFLDRCIDEFRSGSNTPEIVEVSAVGEILKYKNMLDTGIITEEEFQIKKSKLLGI